MTKTAEFQQANGFDEIRLIFTDNNPDLSPLNDRAIPFFTANSDDADCNPSNCLTRTQFDDL